MHLATARRWLLTFVLLGLVVGAHPAAMPAVAARAPQAHPALLQLKANNPQEEMAVVVRHSLTAEAARAQAHALGATLTRELGFINAYVARMPASVARTLSAQPGVHWVTLDAALEKSGGPDGAVATAALLNLYNKAIGADKLWALGYQGSSVTVAVVDSGIVDGNDFKAQYGGNGDLRIIAYAPFASGADSQKDWFGHGTHVAGIIAGNGTLSAGRYIGVAPKAKLVAVDVSNAEGAGTMSDLIAGLQWVYDNRQTHNIRVVNISLNSSVAESYHTSPLSAAVEILWFNGIVVVVSAGNNGTANLFPPANDPFVITVGATDMRGNAPIKNDVVASFSAYGQDETGRIKPDLVAPGKDLVSVLAKADTALAVGHPSHRVHTFSGSQDLYFRMSGTSMAAPVVAGAVALLLQDEPGLTPDQVKYRLMATANKNWHGYTSAKAGAGYLNAYAAVMGTTTQSANTGLPASQLLWTGASPVTWSSVSWSSVSWSSVSWSSVSWSSVSWSSVSWSSDHWDD